MATTGDAEPVEDKGAEPDGKGGEKAVAKFGPRIPEDGKIVVFLRPTGSAPILIQSKFKVKATHTFAAVVANLRKQLKLRPTDPLFVYCNTAFAPNPDEIMHDIYQCFGLNGEIVLNYCMTEAWG